MTSPSALLVRSMALLVLGVLGWALFVAGSIVGFARKSFEVRSDVAIVLGAGTEGDQVSPVFKGRLDHAAELLRSGVVHDLILAGGVGRGQSRADSEIGRDYLVAQGVPHEALHVETVSRYTIENLVEAQRLMDSLGMTSALIVSDPLHMKRSVALAEKTGIRCLSSPTRTSAYRSFGPKANSLAWETFFFMLGRLSGFN